jgi:hypothetical protein
MEKKIAEKCQRVFQSCILMCHVRVAEMFLTLALKKVTPESEYYSMIADEWTQLNDRVRI